MRKWLRFGGAVLLGTSFLLQAACAGNSASSSSESSSSTETEENVCLGCRTRPVLYIDLKQRTL